MRSSYFIMPFFWGTWTHIWQQQPVNSCKMDGKSVAQHTTRPYCAGAYLGLRMLSKFSSLMIISTLKLDEIGIFGYSPVLDKTVILAQCCLYIPLYPHNMLGSFPAFCHPAFCRWYIGNTGNHLVGFLRYLHLDGWEKYPQRWSPPTTWSRLKFWTSQTPTTTSM